ATPEIVILSLHDALPISAADLCARCNFGTVPPSNAIFQAHDCLRRNGFSRLADSGGQTDNPRRNCKCFAENHAGADSPAWFWQDRRGCSCVGASRQLQNKVVAFSRGVSTRA